MKIGCASVVLEQFPKILNHIIAEKENNAYFTLSTVMIMRYVLIVLNQKVKIRAMMMLKMMILNKNHLF